MSTPKKKKSKARTKQLYMRISSDLHKTIKAEARQRGLTIAELARRRLENSYFEMKIGA